MIVNFLAPPPLTDNSKSRTGRDPVIWGSNRSLGSTVTVNHDTLCGPPETNYITPPQRSVHFCDVSIAYDTDVVLDENDVCALWYNVDELDACRDETLQQARKLLSLERKRPQLKYLEEEYKLIGKCKCVDVATLVSVSAVKAEKLNEMVGLTKWVLREMGQDRQRRRQRLYDEIYYWQGGDMLDPSVDRTERLRAASESLSRQGVLWAQRIAILPPTTKRSRSWRLSQKKSKGAIA